MLFHACGRISQPDFPVGEVSSLSLAPLFFAFRPQPTFGILGLKAEPGAFCGEAIRFAVRKCGTLKAGEDST
jgi:hypothetical protein